ncbi:NAD(+) diphosphatase [Aestuariimicrobium kwangyangense]|uniref:NAD(+) diphosphatase n=1 Tax=Aestuariimicrobium kwangyangense TaxID=396389 RepID=UPI0003F5F205|nr:NAD(+) diphosphatase [Aestuariimicrobium kwangyangense]
MASIPRSTRVLLDRQADLRSDHGALVGLWQRETSRLVGIDASGALRGGFERRPTGEFDPQRHVFLGVGGGREWFAVEVGVDADTSSIHTLREGTLHDLEEEVVATAAALLGWHRREPRCEKCSGTTSVAEGGFVRLCNDCGAQVFPRTDPAMIVVLLDPADRLLLAHAVGWPERRMSLLAGFVEAGESLEAAVVREVDEEARLRVTHVGYLASQPWPFPRSLMLGCVARVEPGEPRVDGVELDQATWFSRASMDEAVASGDLVLSPMGSIARRMIEAWRAGSVSAADAAVAVVRDAGR